MDPLQQTEPHVLFEVGGFDARGRLGGGFGPQQGTQLEQQIAGVHAAQDWGAPPKRSRGGGGGAAKGALGKGVDDQSQKSAAASSPVSGLSVKIPSIPVSNQTLKAPKASP